MASPDDILSGLRLLLVEDEAIILMMMEEVITGFGCLVAGAASTVSQALKIVQTEPLDGALIDVRLDGETTLPLAHALSKKGIPFIFVTGFAVIPLEGVPVLHKPFQEHQLRSKILKHLKPAR